MMLDYNLQASSLGEQKTKGAGKKGNEKWCPSVLAVKFHAFSISDKEDEVIYYLLFLLNTT